MLARNSYSNPRAHCPITPEEHAQLRSGRADLVAMRRVTCFNDWEFLNELEKRVADAKDIMPRLNGIDFDDMERTEPIYGNHHRLIGWRFENKHGCEFCGGEGDLYITGHNGDHRFVDCPECLGDGGSGETGHLLSLITDLSGKVIAVTGIDDDDPRYEQLKHLIGNNHVL